MFPAHWQGLGNAVSASFAGLYDGLGYLADHDGLVRKYNPFLSRPLRLRLYPS